MIDGPVKFKVYRDFAGRDCLALVPTEYKMGVEETKMHFDAVFVPCPDELRHVPFSQLRVVRGPGGSVVAIDRLIPVEA